MINNKKGMSNNNWGMMIDNDNTTMKIVMIITHH